MNQKLGELKQRQLDLVARAAAQRNELSELAQQLQTPLSWIDKGISLSQSIKAHPKTSAFAVLASSLTMGRYFPNIRKWVMRCMTAYQLGRSFIHRN